MSLDIPSPSEVAERNREKDESGRLLAEAKDDQLLEIWIERAKRWLVEDYRGTPIDIHFHLVCGSHVYYPDRFARMVIDRFQGTSWRCEYLKYNGPERNAGYGEIRFYGSDDPDSPQPIEATPKPKPTFWQTFIAYLADREP